MKYIKNKTKLLMILLFALTLSGCSSSTNKKADDKLNVIATTTMLGDLTSIIGGNKVEVTYLMGPGVDPHLYQASANDVTALQNADVVVYNGVHLEGKMGDVFGSLEKSDKNIICIEKALDEKDLLTSADDNSTHDPHIWFNVGNWKKAALFVKDQLSIMDEENAQTYDENYQNYIVELDNLETYIKDRIEELSEEQRVLITAHDAFGYFGKAYGFDVKGLQGISTDAEAATSDISKLADFITENKIKAIFVESSVPAKTVESLQAAVKERGFDVKIGGELYSDSLGDKKSGHDSYVTTFKANIDTIVDALK